MSCRRKNLSPRATPTPAPRRSQRPSRRAAAALRRQRPHGPQAVSVPLRAPRHRPRHIVDRTPDQRVPQHLDPAPFPASPRRQHARCRPLSGASRRLCLCPWQLCAPKPPGTPVRRPGQRSKEILGRPAPSPSLLRLRETGTSPFSFSTRRRLDCLTTYKKHGDPSAAVSGARVART